MKTRRKLTEREQAARERDEMLVWIHLYFELITNPTQYETPLNQSCHCLYEGISSPLCLGHRVMQMMVKLHGVNGPRRSDDTILTDRLGIEAAEGWHCSPDEERDLFDFMGVALMGYDHHDDTALYYRGLYLLTKAIAGQIDDKGRMQKASHVMKQWRKSWPTDDQFAIPCWDWPRHDQMRTSRQPFDVLLQMIEPPLREALLATCEMAKRANYKHLEEILGFYRPEEDAADEEHD